MGGIKIFSKIEYWKYRGRLFDRIKWKANFNFGIFHMH